MMGRFEVILAAGCATFVIASVASGIALATSSETVIHNFAKPAGASPTTGPVIDALTGAIYGATWEGGTTGYGVVYQLLPPTATNVMWTYTVIANNKVSYAQPYVMVSNRVVYVSSSYGGTCASCGSIVSLAPPASGAGVWTTTVLYAFTGATDGGEPRGSLAIDDNGVFYGTAADLGSYGTVFTLSPPSNQGQPWRFSVLHTFHGTVAGQGPVSGVILDKQGNLYGSEPFDDFASGKSFIFKLAPSGGGKWTESVLYRFNPASKCYSSGPLAIDALGALYGVFSAHASVTSVCADSSNEYVFQLAPSKSDPNVWVKTNLRGFTQAYYVGGYELTAPVTVDAGGNVYGTTLSGGTGDPGSAGGTVFVLQPPTGNATKWSYAPVSGFSGYEPNGGMVFDSAGVLYGTTQVGGIAGHGGSKGIVFSLIP